MRKGHKYKTVLNHGECLRTAVASTTGIPRRKIPFIDGDNEDFWAEWVEWLSARGLGFWEFYPDDGVPDGFWIAIVESEGEEFIGSHHAVIYKGTKLWDPNSGGGTYKEAPILYGLEVKPLD